MIIILYFYGERRSYVGWEYGENSMIKKIVTFCLP
jgi:hypothetical protein